MNSIFSKKHFAFLLILVLTITFSASFATEGSSSTINNAKFDKMYYTISLNEVLKPVMLTLDGKPLTIKNIAIVNGADVVKLEKGNIIKPLKLGYAMITATATNGLKAETSINVYEGIVCDTYKLALTVGETTSLNLHSKNSKPIVSALQYASIDPTIATIDEKGTITALSAGQTTISVGNSQESLLIQVGVFAAEDPAKTTYLNMDNLTMQLFNTYINNANLLEVSSTKPAYPVINDGGQVIQLSQLKISSSNPAVLSVITKGYEYNVLYAKKAGTVTLTLSANGVSKDFPITVTAEPKIKSIKIIKKDTAFNPVTWEKIKIGLDMYLILQVTYVDGSTRELMGSYEGISWKSSNPSVALVNDHLLRGLKVGTVTITATYKGKSTNFKINIVTGEH